MADQIRVEDLGEYDGWPLKYMTLTSLLLQGDEQGVVQYVWPYEGKLVNGRFKFHGGTVMDGETPVECPKAPLMIDGSSARSFKLVWNAINAQNRAKTHEYLGSRGLTVWMFNELIWPNVSFGTK